MIYDWPDLQGGLGHLTGEPWTEEETLLEFDGPQLQILSRAGARFLSVAADEVGGTTRWIRVPLSATEEEALKRGAAGTFHVLEGKEFVITDVGPDGAVTAEAALERDRVPPAVLPGPDSFLPHEVIASFSLPVREPAFRLDGPNVARQEIPFSILGDVTTAVQRLWNALGQSLEGTATAAGRVPAALANRTELRLRGVSGGSVVLHLEPGDAELFPEVATTFARITRSSGSPRTAAETLRALPPRVWSAYTGLSAALAASDTALLAVWGRGAAYLGPGSARRVREVGRVVLEEPAETVRAVGYFSEFDLKGKFRFEDIFDGEVYEGRVSDQIVRRLDQNVSVGSQTTYRATLSLFHSSALVGEPRPICVLEDFEAATSAPERFRQAG